MKKRIYYKPEIQTGFFAAYHLMQLMKFDVKMASIYDGKLRKKLQFELSTALDVLADFMYDCFLMNCFGLLRYDGD